MDVELAPGKYIVAVSGGVDSVVLLNLLSKKPSLDLVVAHFDHGIRDDSSLDRKLVESLAREYKLEFYFGEGKLGISASEDLARKKRYEFLEKIRQTVKANAIITAHHQDDLLETAIINLIRGTNRRGLSALKSTGFLKRPLLEFSKSQIKLYAIENDLKWHEDSTNFSDKYLRNYVRHNIVDRIDDKSRVKFLQLIDKNKKINLEIDGIIDSILDSITDNNDIDRLKFLLLDYKSSREVMAMWLRRNGLLSYDKQMIERLVVGAKVANVGVNIDIAAGYRLRIDKYYLALIRPER